MAQWYHPHHFRNNQICHVLWCWGWTSHSIHHCQWYGTPTPTLIEMKWPQGQSPTQTNNSTAVGVINNTIFPKRNKSMDMKFHWLRCRMPQIQFRFYWAPGTKNLGYYRTNHHPPLHHLVHRSTHAGVFKLIYDLQGFVNLLIRFQFFHYPLYLVYLYLNVQIRLTTPRRS